MKSKYLLYLLFLSIFGGKEINNLKSFKTVDIEQCNDQIAVLNFGTFHFTYSSDAHVSYLDVKNPKIQHEIRTLNESISTFKPTVILIERPASKNEEIQRLYKEHLNVDTLNTSFYGEIGLVAFEVGKLSDCNRIYGIDDREYYNWDWRIGIRNQESIQDPTYAKISDQFEESKYIDSLPLMDTLKMYNTQEYRDFMINLNIDNLHYVNTPGSFDATDQAMRMYQRNVRWFANINKLELSKNDRIFLIAGASHTSFLHDMLKRSPKFCVVEPSNYLN